MCHTAASACLPPGWVRWERGIQSSIGMAFIHISKENRDISFCMRHREAMRVAGRRERCPFRTTGTGTGCRLGVPCPGILVGDGISDC